MSIISCVMSSVGEELASFSSDTDVFSTFWANETVLLEPVSIMEIICSEEFSVLL